MKRSGTKLHAAHPHQRSSAPSAAVRARSRRRTGPPPAPSPAPSSSSGPDAAAPARLPALATTGYVLDYRLVNHKPLPGSGDEFDHPESFCRLVAISNELEASGLLRRCREVQAVEASDEDVLRVHTADHHALISSTEGMAQKGLRDLVAFWNKESVFACGESAFCARLAAGGTLQLVRQVHSGEIRNGFAVVRPPGHHAEHDKAMGFCLYNNVAISVRHLREVLNVPKVLILDWDVHHGNGIQQVFLRDPSVLYISLHRYDSGHFYPGTFDGCHEQVGEGPGIGFSVNIAWNGPGMGDPEYLYAFREVVLPIAYEFSPDFVLVAAGFDAAEGDAFGGCRVSPGGYATMAHQLMALANGKLVMSLEGGYNIDSMATSVRACMEVLLGDPPRQPVLGRPVRPDAVRSVRQTVAAHSQYWQSLNPPAFARPKPDTGLDFEAPSFSLADAVKAYRSKRLFDKFGMVNLPIGGQKHLAKVFLESVFCSMDLYSSTSLCVFVHSIGPVAAVTEIGHRVDLRASQMTEDIFPYIQGALSAGSAVIDIGVAEMGIDSKVQDGQSLLEHIWDLHVRNSSAERVCFLCAGALVEAVTEVISRRPSIARKVRFVMVVPGSEEDVPLVDDAQAQWYFEHSYVVAPAAPPWKGSPGSVVDDRRYGRFFAEGDPDQTSSDQLRSMRNKLLPHLISQLSPTLGGPPEFGDALPLPPSR